MAECSAVAERIEAPSHLDVILPAVESLHDQNQEKALRDRLSKSKLNFSQFGIFRFGDILLHDEQAC